MLGDMNQDGYNEFMVWTINNDVPSYAQILSRSYTEIDDYTTPVPDFSLDCYPNPFRGGALHIEVDKAEDRSPNPDHISLYNLKGQLIMQCETKASDWQQDTLALSLPDMPNGVYLLKLTDRKGHRISKKIVVTK